MKFRDFLNLLSFLPYNFFNDFYIRLNDKDCTDICIDFKEGIINFKSE